MSAKIQKSR